MTRYERGFMHKLAEHGVSKDVAYGLLKAAFLPKGHLRGAKRSGAILELLRQALNIEGKGAYRAFEARTRLVDGKTGKVRLGRDLAHNMVSFPLGRPVMSPASSHPMAVPWTLPKNASKMSDEVLFGKYLRDHGFGNTQYYARPFKVDTTGNGKILIGGEEFTAGSHGDWLTIKNELVRRELAHRKAERARLARVLARANGGDYF